MSNKKQSITEIRLGLLGLGTVGSGVVKILRAKAGAIRRQTGISLVLEKVCVRSLSKKRAVSVSRKVLTTHPKELLNNPSINIFIELAGGVHPAKELIQKALSGGKHVVTANKALLAEAGDSLFDLATKKNRSLGLEASVCGGIPIIRAITGGLATDDISHFLGIVNGTCNHILTAMSERGMEFETALKEAQAHGYAETDPRLDIDGIDSAHKLAILAHLAFHSQIPFRSIHIEGIRKISATDIRYAKELGYVVKLLAIGKRKYTAPRHSTGQALELRVHPTLLPLDHPLASVRGVYNAVFLHGRDAGDQLFYGRGAGQMPTATAVMSDILDIAKDIRAGNSSVLTPAVTKEKILPMESIRSQYYLRFQVADKPGVLGMIAKILGQHHISIMSVHQKESRDAKSVPVVILTYEASEKNLQAALKLIDAKKDIAEKTALIRIEG